MYIHSVKVPQLYKAAAKFVKQITEEGKGVKAVVFSKARHRVSSHYALVVTTLRKLHIVDILLQKTNLLSDTPIDPWLARVLVTELLWRKNGLKGESKPVKTVLSLEQKLREILAAIDNVDETEPKETKPKYIRVNTLKATVKKVIKHFCKNGWTFISSDDNSDYHAFLATVRSLTENQFMRDFHVKELLVFPPKSQFHGDDLYIDGKIIIQDKSSCLAVQLLDPPEGAVVLDMCAAPGMKTSQLSAMVGSTGKIYAIEKNKERYDIMQELMKNYSVTNTSYFNGSAFDFVDFPDVRYILVDPSCSGSGIKDRVDFQNPSFKNNKNRISSLASFQIKILQHALTKFQKAKRVVYSTCSINPEENENVVLNVLKKVKNYDLVAISDRLKPWYNFGSEDFGDVGSKCLVTKPEEDLTNGFFVAVFERTKKHVTNPYYIDDDQLITSIQDLPEQSDTEDARPVVQSGSSSSEINESFDVQAHSSDGYTKSKKRKRTEDSAQLEDAKDKKKYKKNYTVSKDVSNGNESKKSEFESCDDFAELFL